MLSSQSVSTVTQICVYMCKHSSTRTVNKISFSLPSPWAPAPSLHAAECKMADAINNAEGPMQ